MPQTKRFDAKQGAQLQRFGANVRRELVGLGLTQEKLGERADLNLRTIQKIEAGELNILLTTIYRLQSVLGCTWQQLLSRELKKRQAGSERLLRHQTWRLKELVLSLEGMDIE